MKRRERKQPQVNAVAGSSDLPIAHSSVTRTSDRTLTVNISISLPIDVPHGRAECAGSSSTPDTKAPASQQERAVRANAMAAVRAEHVIDCLPDHQVFRTPLGDAYIELQIDGHRETWPVQSPRVRRILRGRYRQTHGFQPPGATIDAALRWLETDSADQTQQISVRVGKHRDEIYLDLCNDRWEAVRITPEGWEVTDKCPVRFVRYNGMMPLPRPQAGGQIDLLRPLLNLPDEDAWILLVGWIFGTLSPDGPYPMLVLSGESDAAKTSVCRMARQVIDPSEMPLRSPPRDEEDLIVAAQHTHIVGFDNLSSISHGLSDSLCRLVTGGALGARRRHRNREEIVMKARRPVVFNGIGDLVERDDLSSRCIAIRPQPIPQSRRMPERELHAQFNEVHPAVLGAFLDAAVTALREVNTVSATNLPRMADFATWVMAGEQALPWKPKAFGAAYARNIMRTTAVRLDGNPVCRAIQSLLTSRNAWAGNAHELHAELGRYVTSEVRRTQAWPPTPLKLRGELDRLAPPLRAAREVDIDLSQAGTITIRRLPA